MPSPSTRSTVRPDRVSSRTVGRTTAATTTAITRPPKPANSSLLPNSAIARTTAHHRGLIDNRSTYVPATYFAGRAGMTARVAHLDEGDGSMAEGLFLVRAVLGLLLFAHGAQKLFGWWGGHGLEGTGGFFHSLGHRPGRQMAALAGGSEATGGLLLFLGLPTPFGAAAILG